VNAEEKARGVANRVPRWIVVVEGWGDDAKFVEYCRTALADKNLEASGAVGPFEAGFYALQATIDRNDLPKS